MGVLSNIYDYREMVFSLVFRDLKGRYKGSVLGFFWTFLNPLLQLCVYTIVFSFILRNGIEDYYLFLFVALIPWIFFGTCVSEGSTCIRVNASLVAKIYFPREILPVSYVSSQFVNMLLSMMVVFLVIAISGKGFNLRAISFLPLIMIIEFFMALGITLLFSGIAVYYRDIQYILGIATMAWQFLTPIMYSIDIVPESAQKFFFLNPMTSVIIAYRDILYYKKIPNISTLSLSIAFGCTLLIVGMFSFKKLERRFAENL